MPMVVLKVKSDFNSYDEERLLETLDDMGFGYDFWSDVGEQYGTTF
jgi:hypothetical protein